MQPLVTFLLDSCRTLGRQPSSGRYRPELDGLRCFAILIVMVWHASLKLMRFMSEGGVTAGIDDPRVAWVPDGAVGVHLFFFLSGMVICRPFLAPLRQPIGRFVAEFYRNRLIRIVPPYALVLLGSYLLIGALGLAPERAPSFDAMRKTDLTTSLLASLVYLSGLLFSGPPMLNPPGWSLEIEMQFYLAAPALIMAYLSLRHRTARLLLGTAIVLAAVALKLWLIDSYGEFGHFRWTLLNYLPLFMLGIVMADLVQGEAAPRRGTASDLLFLASILVLLLTGVLRRPEDWLDHAVTDAATLAALLGLYYGATRGRLANRLLSLRPVAVTGAACYSIYLTHVFVMHVLAKLLIKGLHPDSYLLAWGVGMLVLLPAALALGFAFHITVEKTFIRLAARRPAPAMPAVLASRS